MRTGSQLTEAIGRNWRSSLRHSKRKVMISLKMNLKNLITTKIDKLPLLSNWPFWRWSICFINRTCKEKDISSELGFEWLLQSAIMTTVLRWRMTLTWGTDWSSRLNMSWISVRVRVETLRTVTMHLQQESSNKNKIWWQQGQQDFIDRKSEVLPWVSKVNRSKQDSKDEHFLINIWVKGNI